MSLPAARALDDATRAHRRTVSLLAVALVGCLGVLDAWLEPSRAAVLVAYRVAWMALLLLAWWLARPGSRLHPRWAEAIAGGGSTAATLVGVVLTGGAASGYFGFLFALPFCMALLLPGALWCAALSGVASTVGGAWMLVGAGTPPREIGRWIATALGMAVLGSFAALASRAAMLRRLEVEQGRARLAEELAENVRRLAVAERLATAGRLAAGVAHEVNNPLAFLRTNVEWLREHLAADRRLPPDVAEALDDATHGVDRIARIVADLRGFCTPAPERPCGARVADTIAEALRVTSVRMDPRVSLSVDAEPDLPAARICRGRLVQVLGNVLANASDAAAGPGALGRPSISVRAWSDGGRVRIAVADSGPGLRPEVRAHLFEPFFTTKDPGRGTGLGLALSREYVARAGGTLEAGNGPGGGAVFELDLPAASAAWPQAGDGSEPPCPSCSYRHGALAAASAEDEGRPAVAAAAGRR